MPELAFAVEGAGAVPHCATPTLALAVRVTASGPDRVRAAWLDCQVRIEARRRPYAPAEREGLVELFGEPGRWSQTLRSLLWTHAGASVPAFEGNVLVHLHVPCTADLEVVATKYLRALAGGVVPLGLLFSGSVFYTRDAGPLQVARVPWSAEATYDLPVATWRQVMDLYFPNTAWLSLRRDVFDRLYAYRTARGLPTWERALDELLDGAAERTRT